ncbi:uncharacterized protein LOC116732300 [Xiphophorus hellerii]|uniref:uncharacterized protein LOC116732300 n=1 Tax=Xiphophorus hellerii TaxID=8084 RepID=UPI0013B37494|nr:uncharacterized protein LOC116732300 [Xiphophorus hellerii]
MLTMNHLSIIAVIGFLLLMFTCKGESQQTGSSQSVTVMVGEVVVLPCFLKPPKDASKMTVEWGRPDLKPRFVFVSLEGQEYTADQNEAYRGRSSMFPENLKNGDVSLKLSDVRISDNGRYRCYLPKEKKEYFVELVVGSVSSPGVSLSGLDVSSSGVKLDCSAAGWYPEPELFWLDGDGNIMSAGPAEKSPDPDGVYTVSSRVTVEKRNYNNFTCRVQQRDINQSRETHIHVPDGFFISQPDCNIFNIFAGILGIIVVIGAAAFIWKWRQTETSKKKLKVKANEEEKQLMIKEKEKLSEKKSKLEEELKYRNEDQRIIDQLIGALMETSEELKNQRKQLSDQREKTEKMIEEDEKKFNTVIDEERNQTGNLVEKKAQGYLKLKLIITESLEKMDKTKKDHQHVELMAQKLVEKTCKEVNRLKERKQEIEKNVEEIKKQLDEMKTQPAVRRFSGSRDAAAVVPFIGLGDVSDGHVAAVAGHEMETIFIEISDFIKNKGDDAFRKVILFFSNVNSSTLLPNVLNFVFFYHFFIVRMILESQSLSLKPSIKAFVFAELMFGFLLLGFTCKGESLETKRPRLVAAMAGDDVVLPCHLGVTVNPDELVVEWGRLDLNPRFVFMWFEGSENVKEKNVAYKGRTSVFTDRLRDGDVSLRLTAVKHSDNGRFRCYNPKEIQEYSVDLLVGSVSSPGVSLSGLDVSSSGVMLDCSAAGWYPEPELFWLDGDGNIMSAGPAEKSPDPDGVYTVSSRVTVEKRNYNNFTCRVQQRDINQSRETHIHVPDGFFIPQPDCSVSIGSMVILLFTLFIGAAAAFIWKWRQTETSKKLKVKANEEEKQLMIKDKEKMSEKKSKLEEELKYRNEDQKIIDQLIGALMETSEELKNQRKQLSEQREKTEKMIEEDEKKFNTIIDGERNQTENMIETRAQGYLKLKAIMTKSLEKMDKTKKDNQHVELMTEKLVEKTCKDFNRLKERKQEIEKNVEEIKKQLDEMKT